MDVQEVLKQGNYELIDVREPMELMVDGEVQGAKNIPLGEIEDRKDEILKLDKPVVLFCRSGNRSGKALDYLKSEGLENGYNGGGFADVNDMLQQ